MWNAYYKRLQNAHQRIDFVIKHSNRSEEQMGLCHKMIYTIVTVPGDENWELTCLKVLAYQIAYIILS